MTNSLLYQLIKPPTPKVGDTYCRRSANTKNPFSKPMIWKVTRQEGKHLELTVGSSKHPMSLRELVIHFKPYKV